MSNVPGRPGDGERRPVPPDRQGGDAVGQPGEGQGTGDDVLPASDGDAGSADTPDPLRPDVAPDARMPRPM